MYIAYAPIKSNSEVVCKLSLVPDKLDENNIAIPIECLPTDGSAILRVGQGDCCSVMSDNNSFIIKPVRPSNIYLTPDLPDKPGASVMSLKIDLVNEEFHVFYADPKGGSDDYKKWEPTKLKL